MNTKILDTAALYNAGYALGENRLCSIPSSILDTYKQLMALDGRRHDLKRLPPRMEAFDQFLIGVRRGYLASLRREECGCPTPHGGCSGCTDCAVLDSVCSADEVLP